MRRNYTCMVIFLSLLLFATQILVINVQGDLSDLSKVTGTTQPLYDVSWKPDGSYALISGGNGIVLKYDGNNFQTLRTTSRSFGETIESLAWKPDGSYALIVGWYATNETGPIQTYGLILKYDGNTFTTLSEGKYLPFYGVGWNGDGSYTLITGGNGTVLRYDGKNIIELNSNVNVALKGVSWKPNGDYALIVGDSGLVLKYDGSTFTPVHNITSKNLRGVAWRTDGKLALITGEVGTLLSYDGYVLNAIPNDVTGWLHGVSWRSGANEALAVGFSGTILEYIEGQASVIANKSMPFNGITKHLRGVSWKPNTQNALIVGYDGTVIEYKSRYKIGELVAVVDIISPNPANETDIITFKGHGAGGTGQIVGYNWSFSFGGEQITSKEFTRKMPAGNHTVYLSVQDSDETWSMPTSKKLTVSSPSSSGNGQQNPQPPTNNQQNDSTNSGGGTDVFTVITSYLVWIIVILVVIVLLIPLHEYRNYLHERKIETEMISFLKNNPNSRLYKVYAHFREKYGVLATRRMNLKKIINNSIRNGRIERTSEDNPKYRLKE